MKFIFDFDDVLFNNTLEFKKHFFSVLAENGVPEDFAKEYYMEIRDKEFSLKNFIATLFTKYNVETDAGIVYENIMAECPKFLNKELIEEVKKLGKNNCYLVTNGGVEFQQDKIKYTNTEDLFDKIYVVPGTKKEIIYKICGDNSKDKIIFAEDRIRFIEDLDSQKCLNLKTILYDDQGLDKLKAEIKEN